LLAELDREAVGIRKTLERVPEGENDWEPHEKSMPLGYLATIVATIRGWIDMVVNMDELDINPPGGSKFKPQEWKTRRDLLEQFEASLKKGRDVLRKTTDDRLLKTITLLLAHQLACGQHATWRVGVISVCTHRRDGGLLPFWLDFPVDLKLSRFMSAVRSQACIMRATC
jgi:hypothetical protein